MTLENLISAQPDLQPLLSKILTPSELEVANDVVDRVRRHLAGDKGPHFRYTNKQRLTHLLEAGEKLRLHAKSSGGAGSEVGLLRELMSVALDHLVMIEPNEFLIARCRVCEKPFMVSRLQAFEELGGHWYPGPPPEHEAGGNVCYEGMAAHGEPDWIWNAGPLAQPAEWEALEPLLEVRLKK